METLLHDTMEEAQRLAGIRELDLANYGSVSVVDRVNVVQGLRTSAGKSFAIFQTPPIVPFPFFFLFVFTPFCFLFHCIIVSQDQDASMPQQQAQRQFSIVLLQKFSPIPAIVGPAACIIELGATSSKL